MPLPSDNEMVEQLWSATMQMATELKKKGIEVDIAKLKNSKMILTHYKTDPHAHIEELMDVKEIINNLQIDQFIAAESLGREFVLKWEEEFKKVRGGKSRYKFTMPHSQFVPGLPRDNNWVRINVSDILNPEEIKRIVKSCGATMKKQEKGYVLITGDKASIKGVLDVISKELNK